MLAALREHKREYENQRQEIEAMLAENDRNLMEARRAVAAAARDRGWGSVQQRQPKPTSTYMTKGKSKGQPKGKKGAEMVEEANWVSSGGAYGKKDKQFSKGAREGPERTPSMGKRLPPAGVLHDRFRDRRKGHDTGGF